MTAQGQRLLALLLFAVLPVAAETPVGPPAYEEASGQQAYPSAASDGDGYLVVWSDPRGEQALVATRLPAQYAVYASNGTAKPIRFSIDADGKPSPVVIEHRKSGREVTVAVATNGRNLLTVWNDQPGEWNTVGIFGRVDAGPARALSLSANEQKSAAI